MAKAHVGSLLVFDPATMGVEGPLPADAVVGIVTERGKENGSGVPESFFVWSGAAAAPGRPSARGWSHWAQQEAGTLTRGVRGAPRGVPRPGEERTRRTRGRGR